MGELGDGCRRSATWTLKSYVLGASCYDWVGGVVFGAKNNALCPEDRKVWYAHDGVAPLSVRPQATLPIHTQFAQHWRDLPRVGVSLDGRDLPRVGLSSSDVGAGSPILGSQAASASTQYSIGDRSE